MYLAAAMLPVVVAVVILAKADITTRISSMSHAYTAPADYIQTPLVGTILMLPVSPSTVMVIALARTPTLPSWMPRHGVAK